MSPRSRHSQGLDDPLTKRAGQAHGGTGRAAGGSSPPAALAFAITGLAVDYADFSCASANS